VKPKGRSVTFDNIVHEKPSSSVSSSALTSPQTWDDTAIADGWDEVSDDEGGAPYYYHAATGATKWERPIKEAKEAKEAEEAEEASVDGHGGGVGWDGFLGHEEEDGAGDGGGDGEGMDDIFARRFGAECEGLKEEGDGDGDGDGETETRHGEGSGEEGGGSDDGMGGNVVRSNQQSLGKVDSMGYLQDFSENDTTEESEAGEEVILVPMEENVDLSHTSPPPSPSPLPEGWAEAPNGSYRNSYTGKTQWTRP
jgi:hypothetical protein